MNNNQNPIIFLDEVWEPINYFGIKDQYMVSTYGTVVDQNGKVMPSFPRRGYPTVTLYLEDGSRRQFYNHRLVAETFVINDDPINKLQIDHNDNCPTNNFYANLEHVTQQENLRREADNLRRQFAETGQAGNFKFTFTVDQVHTIMMDMIMVKL
jgi:hypothetical protein